MKIVKLKVNNFMSFGEGNDIALADRGLLLIDGENLAAGSASSNGAGKTSLVDAIPFAIFGETTKGILVDEVVNSKAGKDCLVSVTVDSAKGLFEITRTRKHSKFNNSLTFRKVDADGNVLADLSGVDTTDTQERINRFLGMTYPIFMNSVYFAQESLKPFCELTDKQIKETFMKILSLERFIGSLEAVRSDINAEQKVLDGIAANIAAVDAEIAGSDARLADLGQKHEEFQALIAEEISVINKAILTEEEQLAKVQNQEKILELTLSRHDNLVALNAVFVELAKTQEEIDRENQKLSEAQNNHAFFEQARQAGLEQIQTDTYNQQVLLAKIQGREEELRQNLVRIEDLKAQLSDLPDIVKLLGDLQTQIEEYTKIRAQLSFQAEQYRDTLEKTARASEEVESRVGTPCPECGRVIEASCFASILEANKAKISECEEEIARFNHLLEVSKTAVDSMVLQKEELEQKKSAFSSVEMEIAKIEGSVGQIKREIENKQAILFQVAILSKRFGERKEEASPFAEAIGLSRLRLEAIEKEFLVLTEKYLAAKAGSSFFADEPALDFEKLIPESEAAIKFLQNNVASKPVLVANLKNYQVTLAQKKQAVSPYLDLIKKEHEARNAFEKGRKGLMADSAKREESLEYLRFVEVAFGYSGLPSFLLDAVTPFLNERAAHYSSIVCDGDLRIEFCTTTRGKRGAVKDKFQIAVSHAYGGDKYRSVSGGEKRRADLCIAQAMQDLVSSFGSNPLAIRVYDEPFSAGLDPEGIEGVINLLDEISVNGQTTLVVSHIGEVKNLCKSVVLVRKGVDGVSKIVE